MRRATPVLATAALALGALSAPAVAQEAAESETPSDNVMVGAGAGYGPSYEGSDDYRVLPVAAVRGQVSGINFSTRGTQLNVDFVPQRSRTGTKLQLGGIVGLRLNRSGGIKDDQVKALGKLDKAVEIGGFIGVTRTGVITSDYDTLSARVSYVHDVADAHGSYLIQPSIDYGTPLSPSAYVGVSVSAEIVGKGYARYYFDVTPAGSLASGLPAFAADDGGLKDVNLTVLGLHSLTGDLRHGLAVVAVGRYGRMLGDFRRSPIVAVAGDRNQWTGGLGLAYSF